jgi:formate dehydrogenase subunit gamma
MPPQEHMNTGQKMWWLVVLGAGALMIITGALMWFFKDIISADAFIWSAFLHDAGFIILFAFSLLHVYLSVVHPLMRGVFWSMWNGTISAKYAESHHKKWYDRIKKAGK